ncbi:MAG: hypothetical protein AB7V00_05205 [Bacilli bacterium]
MNKTRRYAIRLTEEEWQLITRKAKDSPASFLREAMRNALGDKIPCPSNEEKKLLQDIRYNLQKIGINFNNFVKYSTAAYHDRSLPMPEYSELESSIENLKKITKRLNQIIRRMSEKK